MTINFDSDHYVNGADTRPYGLHSTDMNRSGAMNAQDIYRLFDLLNGVGTFIVWNTKSLPTNTCAAQSGPGGDGVGIIPPGGPSSPPQANAELFDAFVTFPTIADPSGVEAENDFHQAAQAIAAFCAAHFSNAEHIALAGSLGEAHLTCASQVGANAAVAAAETLIP